MTCSTCGNRIAPGISWCDRCKAPVEFSAPDLERMKVDVRARILWADDVETVRGEWLSKGAPASAVRNAVDLAVAERRRHFRKRGAIDFLLGIGALSGAVLMAWWGYAGLHRQIFMSKGEFEVVIVAVVLGPPAGFWLTFRGIHRLKYGGEGEQGASDLSESD